MWPLYRYSASSSNAVLLIRSVRAACTHKMASRTARLIQVRRRLDVTNRIGPDPCFPPGSRSTRVLSPGPSGGAGGSAAPGGGASDCRVNLASITVSTTSGHTGGRWPSGARSRRTGRGRPGGAGLWGRRLISAD